MKTKKLKIDLSIGDSAKVLRENFEENSVDVLITDPPYGLGQEPDPVELLRSWIQEGDHAGKGGGFMNANWDSIVPGPEIWREVLRVLKPGARGAVFSGTRTLDLMTASLRISGFSVEKIFAWAYGCYSDDTDILTPEGWKKGTEVLEGDKVAAWDPETEEIRFVPVQRKILAPYKGDMIHFKNDNTDQLLTPNHRVYAKPLHRKQTDGIRKTSFEDQWEVKEAGEINRWNTVNLPLSGRHEGPGIGGKDFASLLGWIWTEGGYDNSGTGVRIYQTCTNQEHVDSIRDLLVRMSIDHKEYSRERECMWFMSGDPALQIREILPDKSPSWDLLWQMTQKEKLAFFDAAMRGDGCTARGSFDFYQKSLEDLEKMQTLAHMIGLQGRINEKAICVSLHDNPKTQLQGKHLKAHHKQHYEGDVWCVTVETGAVMVRRNGRIFISGNSGFPKSQNVFKILKKKLKKDGRYGPEGNARCQCGSEKDNYIYDDSLFDINAGPDSNKEQDRKLILDDYEDHDLTCRVCSWCLLPDDQYVESINGLGTALKPAWEPCLIVRKPELPIQLDLPALLANYGCSEDQIEYIMTPPKE